MKNVAIQGHQINHPSHQGMSTIDESTLLNRAWECLSEINFKTKTFMNWSTMQSSMGFVFGSTSLVKNDRGTLPGAYVDNGRTINRLELSEEGTKEADQIIRMSETVATLEHLFEQNPNALISKMDLVLLKNLRTEMRMFKKPAVEVADGGKIYRYGEMGVFVPGGMFSKPAVAAFDHQGARTDFPVRSEIGKAMLKEALQEAKKDFKQEKKGTAFTL